MCEYGGKAMRCGKQLKQLFLKNKDAKIVGRNPESEEADFQFLAGEALSDVIFQWSGWVFRRVDSFHTSYGARGRIKHSIDAIPPADPRLAYDEFEREYESFEEVKGQLMVPLAFIEKKPMRHFDATLSDGTAVPILGSGEVREVMTSTLVLLLTKNGVEQTQALSKAMLELVSSSGADNRSKVECLLETGKWKGVPLWDPKKLKNQNDLGLQELLLNLSTDFLLIGLIPASRAGVRQVLKFSYHWIVDVPNSGFLRRLGLSLLIAFRHSTFEISLRMHMPSAAKSYHLEFHAPPELDIVKLSLPDGEERFDYQGNHSTDIRGLPVAHVYGKFNEAPLEDAKVEVSVPRFKGVWLTAFLASLLTTMVFALALLLPGAMATLERVGGNAATLMLAIPALFLSFF